MRQIKKLLFLFLFIILLSIFIRMFIGEPCHISSASMEPTIKAGDWLWIDKVSYGAVLPVHWADIPLLNIFTWIRSLQEKDMEINWGYRRLKGFKTPQVNDIIVFKNPENKEILLVKRIIEVLPKGIRLIIDSTNFKNYEKIITEEGNSIDLYQDSIFINGQLNDTYQLKNNYYFLLGDNSAISRDSRFFGYVCEKDIIGKVNSVLFSTEKGQYRFLEKLK